MSLPFTKEEIDILQRRSLKSVNEIFLRKVAELNKKSENFYINQLDYSEHPETLRESDRNRRKLIQKKYKKENKLQDILPNYTEEEFKQDIRNIPENTVKFNTMKRK